ncbi:ABC transporter permease [Gilvimarinus sp. F26214L]|uniref:ABC transporter permease n=1 Tax=Gilvimarinus sp. DZF01 TaxID=3461371 RepID=UPI00404666FA
MRAGHALGAFAAIAAREFERFVRQRGRLLSSLVRPLLWLGVFAAGFQNVFGVSIIPPYDSYVTYQEYVLPGLLGMILLFQGMQSSLSMVYDREMGMMRLLLTAPLPRGYLLFSKLAAGTLLSVAQAYAFLAVAWTLDVSLPPLAWLTLLPALALAGLMLGALGLMLSVYIRQMENFAGAMNFVIFPMFFISPALYPLWRLEEAAAEWIYQVARFNPFSHGVDLIRFAAYGQLHGTALAIVCGWLAAFMLVAIRGYDPQRGLLRRVQRPA